jgi:hypothetical protein
MGALISFVTDLCGEKNKKAEIIPIKKEGYGSELTEEDYVFLTSQTGLSRDDIKNTFEKFNKNNPGKFLVFTVNFTALYL